MFRLFSHNRLAWLHGPQGAAYAAALGLIAIQVGIGIIMKISQSKGTYDFSPSSSVTISEFFKMLLSTLFFYRECKTRIANREPAHTPLPTSERNSFEETKPFAEDQTSDLNGNGHSMSPTSAYTPAANMDIKTFILFIRNEVSRDTRYGFAQLALFYALINNTIFVAYKLADPGTIQLTKSGVTFITALVMIATLGSKITKIQWIAIVIQICGLMVTQYHPEEGTAYPISTYLILLFQVFLSALSGVYNQALLKSDGSSLHADNMILYASGAAINLLLHLVIRVLKADEPGFFTGYGSIGACLVILSNVFIGLAITAVYKYADAVIKCFATAVATGILLYLSPILFGTELSFLVLPGTIVVFIASWLYMEGAAPKDTNASMPKQVNEPTHPSIFSKMSAVSRLHQRRVLGIASFFTVVVVAFLTMSNSRMPDRAKGKTAGSQPAIDEAADLVLESPFKNTLAMVRWNSDHPERMPLLQQYAPFFHDLHFSMPGYVKGDVEFHNLTHDSFPSAEVIYTQIAKTMQLILDAPAGSATSEIEGLFYYHFDAWIDPLAYAGSNMHNIWFPDIVDQAPPNGGGPRFECMTDPKRYDWWGWGQKFHHASMAASAVVDHFDMDYNVNPYEWCIGWTDIYYVPRRFFADYIFLSSIFGGFSVFHEVAVPTMLHIIDESRRRHPSRSIIDRFGDCWGSCCASNPNVQDILWNRCGHRLDYVNEKVTAVHYERLGNQTAMLGEPIGETVYAHKRPTSPNAFSAETLTALTVDEHGVKPANVTSESIDEANAEMDRLARQREKNLEKIQEASESIDGFLEPEPNPLTDGSSKSTVQER
ncbi:UDP-galactose transporter [Coleophoma cylindrospora]|uniref:UDP-galactose transporter n=1 Tax=Coleophoma cylindrospora TaxID=1849047 RepID=A0A3D8SEV4_9HELO|nr:UDP-galactose transporter [Coleophoma cylindrospora]